MVKNRAHTTHITRYRGNRPISQALIGLSYFVSSIWEKEKRAANFAFLQFLIMTAVLIAYLSLVLSGFLKTKIGLGVLIAGYIVALLAAYLLLRRTAPNQKALKGTRGLITGEVKRHDERAIVFARNRSPFPHHDREHGQLCEGGLYRYSARPVYCQPRLLRNGKKPKVKEIPKWATCNGVKMD